MELFPGELSSFMSSTVNIVFLNRAMECLNTHAPVTRKFTTKERRKFCH